jgi:hypothetical protein
MRNFLEQTFKKVSIDPEKLQFSRVLRKILAICEVDWFLSETCWHYFDEFASFMHFKVNNNLFFFTHVKENNRFMWL